jgi:hypothetical protein
VLSVLATPLIFTLPKWRTEYDDQGFPTEIRSFRSPLATRASQILLLFSTILALLSTMWQHIAAVAAANAISTALGGAISHHVGTASMALAWTTAGVTALMAVVNVIGVLSITMFNALVDEDAEFDQVQPRNQGDR